MTTINYSLKHYVRDLYSANAGKRGGEIFSPIYKKDLKPFILRVKCAVNQPSKVLSNVATKYPVNLN